MKTWIAFWALIAWPINCAVILHKDPEYASVLGFIKAFFSCFGSPFSLLVNSILASFFVALPTLLIMIFVPAVWPGIEGVSWAIAYASISVCFYPLQYKVLRSV